jgi:hypothetical protein
MHAYVCLRMLTHALLILYYEAGGALRVLALLERGQEANVLPHAYVCST